MSVRAPAGAMGKTAYDVVLGRGVAGIKGNEFVYQLLVKMDSEGFWKKMAAGSTFESVNSDVVKNAEMIVPQDIEEQETIGSYFQQLDTLITLHQCKCQIIRFKCLNDWEQRKLNDMCDLITKQTGFDYSTTIKPALVTMHEEHTYSFIQNKDFDGERIEYNSYFQFIMNNNAFKTNVEAINGEFTSDVSDKENPSGKKNPGPVMADFDDDEDDMFNEKNKMTKNGE